MPKRERSKVVRKHVWLFESDDEFLRDTYGGRIPLAKVVRSVVHNFVKEAQAKIEQANDQASRPSINLEDMVSADDLAAEEA